MNTSSLVFQKIVFIIHFKASEIFKKNYKWLSSKMNISSEEIWQRSDVLTTFFCNTGAQKCILGFSPIYFHQWRTYSHNCRCLHRWLVNPRWKKRRFTLSQCMTSISVLRRTIPPSLLSVETWRFSSIFFGNRLSSVIQVRCSDTHVRMNDSPITWSIQRGSRN